MFFEGINKSAKIGRKKKGFVPYGLKWPKNAKKCSKMGGIFFQKDDSEANFHFLWKNRVHLQTNNLKQYVHWRNKKIGQNRPKKKRFCAIWAKMGKKCQKMGGIFFQKADSVAIFHFLWKNRVHSCKVTLGKYFPWRN